MASRKANGLKRWLRKVDGFYRWTLEIRDDKSKIPVSKKIPLIANGFIPRFTIGYDFQKYDKSLYLSDRGKNIRAVNINDGFVEAINNKITFSNLISPYVRVPQMHCYFRKGKILALNNSGVASYEDIIGLLKTVEGNRLVFKMTDASDGKGIFILEYSEADGFSVNTDPIDEDGLRRKIAGLDDYYASEFIYPDGFSKNVAPETLNTIRIVTMIDPETGQAFIARAWHRFGCKSSYPLDKLFKGAVGCTVEVATGEIIEALAVKGQGLTRINRHPETGVEFAGLVIPNWDKVVKAILDLANSINYYSYVGWDVVALDNGEIIILEGNVNTGVWILQQREPLLADERIRRFYRYHGVVK